jgi:hypothetical protein
METEYERLAKRAVKAEERVAKLDELFDELVRTEVAMGRLEQVREEAARARDEAARAREEAARARSEEKKKKEAKQAKRERARLEEKLNAERARLPPDGAQIEHLRRLIEGLSIAKPVLEPPEPISAPSRVSHKEIVERVATDSLVEGKVYVDICELMCGNTEASSGDLVRLIRLCFGRDVGGQLLNAAPRAGLFQGANPVPRKEQFVTSVITTELALLKPMLGSCRARWMHQSLDRAGGELDISLYVERDETVWSPVMVFEFGLGCSSKGKADQVLAYCVNVSSQLRAEEVLLAAEVVLWPKDHPDCTGWVRLTAVRLVEGRKIGAVLLWEGCLTEASAGRLLAAAELCAAANIRSGPAWLRCKNASLSDGRVWKVFDYRGRAVPEVERRSCELSLRYIEGCRIHCAASDLRVISYPFIAGSHDPSTVKHFVSLIERLQALHKDGVVHGDVRASNVVFGENGTASLIDFDLAGRGGEKKYPAGYVLEVGDGARHRTASAGRLLEFAHDFFAVGAMMKLCTCDDEGWQRAQNFLLGAETDAVAALKVLEQIAGQALVVKKSVPENVGTGSPERKA